MEQSTDQEARRKLPAELIEAETAEQPEEERDEYRRKRWLMESARYSSDEQVQLVVWQGYAWHKKFLDVEAEAKKLRETADDVERRREEIDEERADLEADKAMFKDWVQKGVQKHAALMQEYEVLKEKSDLQGKQLEVAQAQNQSLQSKNNRYAFDVERTKKEKKHIVNELEKKLRTSEERVKDLQAKRDEMQTTLDTIERRMRTSEVDAANAKEETRTIREELKRELAEKDRQLAVGYGQTEAVAAQFAAWKTEEREEVLRQREENKRLTTELVHLHNSKKSVKKQSKQKDEKIAKLEEEIQALRLAARPAVRKASMDASETMNDHSSETADDDEPENKENNAVKESVRSPVKRGRPINEGAPSKERVTVKRPRTIKSTNEESVTAKKARNVKVQGSSSSSLASISRCPSTDSAAITPSSSSSRTLICDDLQSYGDDVFKLSAITTANVGQFVHLECETPEQQEENLRFLAWYGILYNNIFCEECNAASWFVKNAKATDGYEWACGHCRRGMKASVRHGSFFSIFPDKSLGTVLLAAASFIGDPTCSLARILDETAAETVVYVENTLMDVVQLAVRAGATKEQIGGAGTTVDVERAVLYKKKFSGTMSNREQQQCLVFLERGSTEYVVTKVADFTISTLASATAKHIRDGTKLVSSEFASLGGPEAVQQAFDRLHRFQSRSFHDADDPKVASAEASHWNAVKTAYKREKTEERADWTLLYVLSRTSAKPVNAWLYGLTFYDAADDALSIPSS